jgi:ribose 5-phosphate isomerase A
VIRQQNKTHFLTDNGNKIVDCSFTRITDIDFLHQQLEGILGVVKTGLFANTLVNKVIVGNERVEVSIMDVTRLA